MPANLSDGQKCMIADYLVGAGMNQRDAETLLRCPDLAKPMVLGLRDGIRGLTSAVVARSNREAETLRLDEVRIADRPLQPLLTGSAFELDVDPRAAVSDLVQAGRYDLPHQAVNADHFPPENRAAYKVYLTIVTLPKAVRPSEAHTHLLAAKKPPATSAEFFHFMARYWDVERARTIVATGTFSPRTGGVVGVQHLHGKRLLRIFQASEPLPPETRYLVRA